MNMGFQIIENFVTCLMFNVHNLIQTLKWLNLVLLLKLPSSDTFPMFLGEGEFDSRCPSSKKRQDFWPTIVSK